MPEPGAQQRGRLAHWLSRVGPLRLRLILVSLFSVVLALTLSGVMVHVMVNRAEEQRLKDSALSQLDEARQVLVATGVTAFRARIDDPDVPQELADQARAGKVAWQRTVLGGHEVIIAASPIGTGYPESSVLSVQVPAGRSSSMLDGLDRALVVAGLGSSLVVLVFAAWVSTRLTRRLGAAAEAAQEVASGDPLLGSGIPTAPIQVATNVGRGRGDEVDRLARAVDSMAQRLRVRLENEQRFTADLAHELRTPLAGLVMAAGLLDDSRPAQLVRERTDRLRTLVEDLLEVSRFESGSTTAQLIPARLGRAVASAVHRAVGEGVPWADTVRVEVDDEAMVFLEQRRVDRIVSNLIKNASVHGAAPVTVSVRRNILTVADAGEGFPEAILAAGPSRFQTKGGGWGLGLTIVRGQATVQGARFALSNASEAAGAAGSPGGAQVQIAFRIADPGGEDGDQVRALRA